MPRGGLSREQIIERAKKILSGEYKGTKLYPIEGGLKSAAKYLKTRKIDPAEIFPDQVEELSKLVEEKKVRKSNKAPKVAEIVKDVEDNSGEKISADLSEIKKSSMGTFLISELTPEHRNNESWMNNIYRHYVQFFYSMFLPVMKPASEAEFKDYLTNYLANVNTFNPNGKC